MGWFKNAVMGIALLFGATILGGMLGGLGDVFAGDLITGTPLGAQSTLSPLLWTGIALGVIYVGREALN
jgi:hypothetical protein